MLFSVNATAQSPDAQLQAIGSMWSDMVKQYHQKEELKAEQKKSVAEWDLYPKLAIPQNMTAQQACQAIDFIQGKQVIVNLDEFELWLDPLQETKSHKGIFPPNTQFVVESPTAKCAVREGRNWKNVRQLRLVTLNGNPGVRGWVVVALVYQETDKPYALASIRAQ